MENLILSLELVFPMFAYMALGFVLKRTHSLKEVTLNQINRLGYSVFLPLFLFRSIYLSNFREDFDGSVLLFAFVGVIAAFVLLMLIIPHLEKDRSNQSVMIQGIYRPNYALFGMAMVNLLYGDEMGMAGIIASVFVPLFSVLAVFLFEFYRGEEGEPLRPLQTALNIIKNPLVVTAAIALFFVFFEIRIPDFVMKPITSLGNMASPLALLVIGAIFSLDHAKEYCKQLTLVTLGKLVVLPGIMVPLAYAFGIQGVNLYVLMTLFASPTAVASFSMATELGGKRELAGLIVAITSVVSIVTTFLWTFVLVSLGWV